jgi:hypothetical protein
MVSDSRCPLNSFKHYNMFLDDEIAGGLQYDQVCAYARAMPQAREGDAGD